VPGTALQISIQAHDPTPSSQWDDGFHGNYWSDYQGEDSNGDGIGDIPYEFPDYGIDRFPLMTAVSPPPRRPSGRGGP
jgi:nitrous oxidase accessory protein NosD